MFFLKFNNIFNNLSHGMFSYLFFLKLSVKITETEIKMKKRESFFYVVRCLVLLMRNLKKLRFDKMFW